MEMRVTESAPGRVDAAPIGFGEALMEQLRWVWARLRFWWLVLGVLLAGSGVLLVNTLTENTWPRSGSMFAGVVLPLVLLVAVSWSLSVWRDDPPKDRDYFWLQPVGREAHTLARVLAGLVWMLGVMAVAAVALAIAILVAPDAGLADHALPPAGFWFSWLGAFVLSYLVGTFAAILSDRPAIWLVLGAILVLLLDGLAGARDWQWVDAVTNWFTSGDLSLGTALFAPGVIAFQAMADHAPAAMQMSPGDHQPVAALLIWLVIMTGAVVGAAFVSRPR